MDAFVRSSKAKPVAPARPTKHHQQLPAKQEVTTPGEAGMRAHLCT